MSNSPRNLKLSMSVAPWLAGRLMIFAVQSAILPIMHWFADNQSWGALRARRGR